MARACATRVVRRGARRGGGQAGRSGTADGCEAVRGSTTGVGCGRRRQPHPSHRPWQWPRGRTDLWRFRASPCWVGGARLAVPKTVAAPCWERDARCFQPGFEFRLAADEPPAQPSSGCPAGLRVWPGTTVRWCRGASASCPSGDAAAEARRAVAGAASAQVSPASRRPSRPPVPVAGAFTPSKRTHTHGAHGGAARRPPSAWHATPVDGGCGQRPPRSHPLCTRRSAPQQGLPRTAHSGASVPPVSAFVPTTHPPPRVALNTPACDSRTHPPSPVHDVVDTARAVVCTRRRRRVPGVSVPLPLFVSWLNE